MNCYKDLLRDFLCLIHLYPTIIYLFKSFFILVNHLSLLIILVNSYNSLINSETFIFSPGFIALTLRPPFSNLNS
jgi:hypothetical protein